MPAPSGPDLCHALAARKKARYLSRLYDGKLAAAGLSVSQFSILSLLESRGRLKIAELADRLVMERTSLVRALKPLQAAGYVVTEASKSARSPDLLLSRAGLLKVVEATPLWSSAQTEFENEVGKELAARQRNEILKMKFGV